MAGGVRSDASPIGGSPAEAADGDRRRRRRPAVALLVAEHARLDAGRGQRFDLEHLVVHQIADAYDLACLHRCSPLAPLPDRSR
jgi:hypothetical protein